MYITSLSIILKIDILYNYNTICLIITLDEVAKLSHTSIKNSINELNLGRFFNSTHAAVP